MYMYISIQQEGMWLTTYSNTPILMDAVSKRLCEQLSLNPVKDNSNVHGVPVSVIINIM